MPVRARRLSSGLAIVLVVALANPAAAHGNLLASTPADSSAVTAPTQIELTFSTFVIAAESTVEVAALNGTQLELGQIERGETAANLIVPLLAKPAPGRYVVRYDITGSDGDSIAGGFDFEVLDANGERAGFTGGAAAVIALIAALVSYVWFALRNDKKRRPNR